MLDQKTKTIYHKPTFISPSWLEPIQADMDRVEIRLTETPPGQHSMLTGTIRDLFNAGGKRVRPSMCLLTARMFDADPDHSISLAAAVEMLHTATLVHDDLIDGAMFRRNIPTLNSIWTPDISVLAGDYLFARAASMISDVEIVPVMKLFAGTLETILNGEITQKFSKWQVDRDEYEERIYAKTAALFVLSTHSAALLGGADPDEIDAMIAFGRSIGTAFQIVDDVLDYTSTSDKLGKPIGGDLRQGLFTLPAILYIDEHPDDPVFNAYLSEGSVESGDVQVVIDQILASGAIEASLKEAKARLNRGRQILQVFRPSPYKDALMELAVQLVERDL